MVRDFRGVATRLVPGDAPRVARKWPSGRRSESGAVLILALVFIIVVSVTVGALAYWVTNGLNSTTQFYTGAQLQYAASAAVQTAVQAIQTAPQPGDPSSALNGTTPVTQATQQSVTVNGTTNTYAAYTSSPGVCWNNTSNTLTVSSINFYNNTLTIAVYCSTLEKLTQSVGANGTRVVTFYACQYATNETAAACQSSALLTAVFSFDDYPVGGGQLLTSQCNVEGLACGEGSTELSWVRG
jgi:Tfp pilus assembly protein PilX